MTERFWEQVDIRSVDQCWDWQGYRTKRGYGRFQFNGKHQGAHRAAWMIKYNDSQQLPSGFCVLHKCDRRCCVNPNHLFLGTQLDNIADMKRKGRANKPKGERHPRSKLTACQVEAIRKDCRKQTEIAEEYGIARGTVSNIKRGYRWPHLNDKEREKSV